VFTHSFPEKGREFRRPRSQATEALLPKRERERERERERRRAGQGETFIRNDTP